MEVELPAAVDEDAETFDVGFNDKDDEEDDDDEDEDEDEDDKLLFELENE